MGKMKRVSFLFAACETLLIKLSVADNTFLNDSETAARLGVSPVCRMSKVHIECIREGFIVYPALSAI